MGWHEDYKKEQEEKDKPERLAEELKQWGFVDRDTITCPFCGSRIEDWQEYVHNMGDGDTDDLTCEECGKDFTYTFCVEISFDMRAKEDNSDSTSQKENER